MQRHPYRLRGPAIPLHEDLIEALKGRRQQNHYKEAQHRVFASPSSGGENPYWGQQLMRRDILPVAEKLGITKRMGWHTFRHPYSTLLRSVGADLKVMQELLRHSTIRVTSDTYTQAVTAAKRTARTRWSASPGPLRQNSIKTRAFVGTNWTGEPITLAPTIGESN